MYINIMYIKQLVLSNTTRYTRTQVLLSPEIQSEASSVYIALPKVSNSSPMAVLCSECSPYSV